MNIKIYKQIHNEHQKENKKHKRESKEQQRWFQQQSLWSVLPFKKKIIWQLQICFHLGGLVEKFVDVIPTPQLTRRCNKKLTNIAPRSSKTMHQNKYLSTKPKSLVWILVTYNSYKNCLNSKFTWVFGDNL